MVANISQKYKECPKKSLIKTKEKLHKTINPHNLKVMRIYLFVISDSYLSYFTSSKTTLTDYQCVSTGCCTHVAKTKITIDNQYVTKSLQRYKFLPKQPKENTEKKHKLANFFRFRLAMECRNGDKTTNGAVHMEALSLFIFLVNRCFFFCGNKRRYFVHIVIFSFISQTIFYFEADHRIFIRLKE